ncbi:CobW/HypB/UreG, nucleotide-binding domain [Nitratireductor aquibiodomus]|jgi:G3E family GTPase|uniref:CobW/HypB/UreG, nucleotide-binding domain n=1 Tax=Nitratireductor aquibiodomus TaxID=204799 RepID=A0A1H4JTE8_9HYPH|nr:GTP-binding protein [Nitratireductor aquibiodomus]SEB49397.1 CobW/HypB/UreG, nucleotide-binding domain [Nitratireductor aquibiodomus]
MSAETLPTPVTALTGYPGAGKTTFLNRNLTEDYGRRYAVIVNEFGAIGIDGALVVDADEEVFQLNNGCVCCSVRGDLIRVLEGLMRRGDRFDAILVETTGLADPAPVEECIRRVDDTASIRPSTRCDVALEDVLDRGAFDLDRILGIDVEFLDAGYQPEHDHDVSSFSLESAVPLEGGHQCRWAPNETRASRMIFIGCNLPRDVIRNGFMECRAVRPLSALSARL